MTTWFWIDYVVIGIIALSIITGLFRGFIKELISLGIWALAIWMAISHAKNMSVFVQPYIADKTACIAVAFVGILVAVLLLGAIINTIIHLILHRSGLSGIDRLLGMGFGFVRGIFIVALLMLVAKMTSLPYQEYRAKSIFYSHFDPLVNWLYGYMPNVIKQLSKFDPSSQSEPSMELAKQD